MYTLYVDRDFLSYLIFSEPVSMVRCSVSDVFDISSFVNVYFHEFNSLISFKQKHILAT